MWCEICETSSPGTHCEVCGDGHLERRRRYRERLLGTLRGWHQTDVIDARTLAALAARIATEQQAIQALIPPPAPVAPVIFEAEPEAPPTPPIPLEPVIDPVAWPVPRPAAPAGPGLESWLRESVGWLVGAGLTVVGSLYLAGTVWGGLSSAWRTVLTVLFLAAWTLGFGILGRRLLARGLGAGAWLVGVSAALAPIHALAAGALWPAPTAVGAWIAVAVFQGWSLARSTRDLAPKAGPRLWIPWLALAMSVGLVPLGLGLAFPTLILVVAAWGLAVRSGGPVVSVAVLLGFTWAIHPLVGDDRPLSAFSLPLATWSGLALYADLAAARWQGLRRVQLRGWRGAVVITLALLALASTLAAWRPMPTGIDVLSTYLTIGGLAIAAALAWRRPSLIGVSALASLGVALTLPSLARELVSVASQTASTGLGYGGGTLPMPWRALTLLPWLLLWQLAARVLPKTGWRQARAMQSHLRHWTMGMALGLLVVAQLAPGDPRPFLVAAPLYGLFGLLRPPPRTPGWVAEGLRIAPIVVALGWLSHLVAWLPIPPLVAQGVVVAAAVAVVVAWPNRRWAVVAFPVGGVLLLLGPPGWALFGWGLVGLAALLTPSIQWHRVRPVALGIAPALVIVGGWTLTLASPWGLPPWWMGLATLVLAAASSVLLRQDRPGTHPLLGAAVFGLAATGILGLALTDPMRLALRGAMGALLLAWIWERRAERWVVAFGVALSLGIAESVWRRLGLFGADQTLAIGAAALIVAVLSRLGGPTWWVKGLTRPAQPTSWALISIGLAHALWSGLPWGLQLAEAQLLVVAAWISTPRGSEDPGWVAVVLAIGASATTVAAGLTLGLAPLPGLAGIAGIVAVAHGLAHGATGTGWIGLAAAFVSAMYHARSKPLLRRPALWGGMIVGLLALEGWVGPPPGVHILLIVIVGAAMGGITTRWPESRGAGILAVFAMVPVLAGGVALAAVGLTTVGPIEIAAAGIAAGVAAQGRAWWVFRAAAVVALAATGIWLGAPQDLWVLGGTGALVAHRLAFPPRGIDDVVERTHVGATLALAVAAATSPGVWPVAVVWPLLAWGLGTAWIPAGLAIGILHAAGLPLNGARIPSAWGLFLAAGALAISRTDWTRSAVVMGLTTLALAVPLLGGGGLWTDGATLPASGLLLPVLLGIVTIGYRWIAPASRADDATGAVLAIGAVGMALGWVVLSPWQPGWAGPPAWAALSLAAAVALSVRQPQPTSGALAVAAALLLSAVPGRFAIDHAVAAPIVLAVAAGWAALARRGEAPALLAVACLAPWLAIPGHIAPSTLALHLAVVTGAAGISGRREIAASTGWIALIAGGVALELEPAWDLLLGITTLWAWSVIRLAPRTGVFLRIALPTMGLFLAAQLGEIGWAVLVLGGLAEVFWALRQPRGTALWAPVGYAAAVLFAARAAGPLELLPIDWALPLAVLGAIVLEASGMILARRYGQAWGDPVGHGATALVLALVAQAAVWGTAPTLGMSAAGAFFCGRHALRGGVPDLLMGVALLDAVALFEIARFGLLDPFLYVAPVSLSALVVAQRLRGTLDPSAVTLIRYVCAGALYVTCFGQVVMDPAYTLVLVLFALIGIAAGQLLKVLSFLRLGIGFLGAAIAWNLMRFGLDNSQFWAIYLMGIGVAVLSLMVVLTTQRERFARLQAWMRSHVASWEG